MNEATSHWFTNRYRVPFHRLAILLKKEKLIADKPEKFSPLQVKSLYDLLHKMAPPRAIPGILSCMKPIPGDFKAKFQALLDPYRQERVRWALDLDKLKNQLRFLDTSPWSSFSPRGLRERDKELELTAQLITGLENKLKGLPPENTFVAAKLYAVQSNEELEADGIICELGGVYPRFTQRGLRIYKTMENQHRLALANLQGEFSVSTEKEIKELSVSIWKAVKKVYGS